MNKNILYGLLFSSMLYLKITKEKNKYTPVAWVVLVSSLFLLIKPLNETFLDRRTGTDNGTNIAIIGTSDVTGATNQAVTIDLTGVTSEADLDAYKLKLTVPEDLALEVLTTTDCRERCQAVQVDEGSIISLSADNSEFNVADGAGWFNDGDTKKTCKGTFNGYTTDGSNSCGDSNDSSYIGGQGTNGTANRTPGGDFALGKRENSAGFMDYFAGDNQLVFKLTRQF